MNLQGKIEYIKNAVTAIKQAIVRKNVTPTGDLSTYADAIDNIETKNNTSLTVNPSTSSQTIRVPAEYTGYDVVTVNPVTNAIDSDITANNIKQGVNILGVNGSVIELQGETRVFNTNGTYTPSSGKNGITEVTVNVPVDHDDLINGTITSVNTDVSTIKGGAFKDCTNLMSLTLTNNTMVNLSDYSIFENTPLIEKESANKGTVYVPSSLINDYRQYYSQIFNISKLIKDSCLISDTSAWHSLTFDEYYYGEFVALHESGYVSISNDGKNWSSPHKINYSNMSFIGAMTYGNQKIVAVAELGQVYYATNVLGTWSHGTSSSNNLSSSYKWRSLAYGNNMYIALSEEGQRGTSTNGTTWSLGGSLSSSHTWIEIVYDGSKFIALATDGYIATSTDGISWTTTSVLGSHTWKTIMVDNTNTKLVAISSNGYISVSFNGGTTWSYPTYNENFNTKDYSVRSRCNNNGNIVVVSTSGLISTIDDIAQLNFEPIS